MPGSQVDVTINVTGPASGAAGTSYSYTATIGNNSLPDADGATFAIALPAGSSGVIASCTALGGASCPAALATSNSQVTGTAGLLPHNGQLVVTITGFFAAPSSSSVTCRGTVNAPAGTTDYDPTSNQSTVGTAMTSQASVVVSQTQTSTTISPGSPNTYTLTWTNNGPAAANGTITSAMMYFRTEIYDHAVLSNFSCTASGGLQCPASINTNVSGNYGSVFSLTQPSFPAGATMTITYTADVVPASPQSCGFTATAIGNDIRATLAQGFSNVGTTDLFIYSTAPGTPACPTTDLSVSKTQDRSSIAPGSPVTYTVTYRNLGPSPADGASLADSMYFATPVQSLAIHIVSCTATGGAACPSVADKTLTSSGQYVLQATAPSFPSGSTIQLTYTAQMTQTANPTCSNGSSTVENRVVVTAPSGIVESGPGANQASVFASAPPPPVCPQATLAVTKTADRTTMFPGDPVTYTVTYTNRGPDPAPGATITDYMNLAVAPFISRAQATIVSCTGTMGVACPSFVTSKSISGSAYLWTGTLASFPAGATLRIEVSLDPVAGGSSCTSATASIPNTATISLPYGMTGANGNSGAIVVTSACADISVNKSLSRSSVQPGDPVTYVVKVSNASQGPARSVQFSDPLPRGFIYSSASCAPSSATSTCAAATYDADSRTLSAVIPVIGAGQGYVTITIVGTAGPVGGTYSNTATALPPASGADRFIDPVMASNSSTAVLTIYGTASKVLVTKRLAGLPAGGVPAPLTFTGSITCDFEGSKPWSATVPAGAASASANVQLFFDGQQCTVSENPPPALPAGLSWVGDPRIEPASLAVAGPSQSYDVSVTNRLTPNAALELAKSASPTQATADQVVTFTYQVTNGGPIAVAAPVIHEMSFSGSGPLPPATCPAGEVAPGQSVQCTASYRVTAADVEAGLLTNVAYATATPSAGPEPQTAAASASVRLLQPPALQLTKRAAPATFSRVGEEISYSYELTNTGGTPLSEPRITESAFSGAGDAPQPECEPAAASLAPGEQATCRASYRITQADLDAGTVVNTAIATANAPSGFPQAVSPAASATITALQRPAIGLTKSVFPLTGDGLFPGTVLSYSFVVTNLGNVTLGQIGILDSAFTGSGELGEIGCDQTRVAPGDQTTCTATYQITTADVGAGSVENTAAAIGTPPTGPAVTSEASSAVFPQPFAPSIALTKQADTDQVHQVGDQIEYSFVATNTGDVPLTGLQVSEGDFTGAASPSDPDCPAERLFPGESVTCRARYTVVGADLNSAEISNSATMTATDPDGGQVTSEPSTAHVTVVPGLPGLTLTKTASPAFIRDAGQLVTYTFTVRNSGQTPLQGVSVTETGFTGSGPAPIPSCPADRSLGVGDQLTCTATYRTTQADLDAGDVVNTAEATAFVPGATELAPVTATDFVDIPALAQPALTLTKSAEPATPDAFKAGQRVTYTFVLANTGNVTLTEGTVLEGTFTGTGRLDPTRCDPGPLAPGAQASCQATYTLTVADVEAGGVSNTAQAVALPPFGAPVTSADAEAKLPVAARPALRLVKSLDRAEAHDAGTRVTYSFALTNVGNVTLSALHIEETAFSGSGPRPVPSCPATALAPGASFTCRASYRIDAADVVRGAVDNTARAAGVDRAGNPVRSAPSSAHLAITPASGDPNSAGRGGAIAPTGAEGGRLAFTGAQLATTALLAVSFVLAGLVLVFAARRRRAVN